MLLCETNTKTVYRKVLAAARKLLGRRRLQADFEHGQWWVTDLDSGAQWGAHDGEGQDCYGGFCFEQVTQGDEE